VAITVGCSGWQVVQARYFKTFGLVEIQESFFQRRSV
jgi:uncharacterized protein YecE (DUF72 family)